MSSSCLTSFVTWVGRGKFAHFPSFSKGGAPDDDENETMGPASASATSAAAAASPHVHKTTASKSKPTKRSAEGDDDDEDLDGDVDPEVIKEFNLETYDDEESVPLEMAPVYENPEDDPYLDNPQEEEDEEIEELTITDNDLFVLSATTDLDDNFHHLDVNLYEEDEDNLYCHHDILLPDFPLSLAWMELKPGLNGNCVAVAGFQPGIELWALDVIDPLQPLATLGGPVGGTEGKKSVKKKIKGKKKKTSKVELVPGSHSDAVLSLSWNAHQKNLLLSGSADKTVKLWDLDKLTSVHTFEFHSDKVQCVQWNPAEPSVISTTSFDRTVRVLDVRTDKCSLTWSLTDSDPEHTTWNSLYPTQLLASQENGNVLCFDALKGASTTSTPAPPLWTLAAHSKATTGVTVCSAARMFATSSLDKYVKLWSYSEGFPHLLTSKRSEGKVCTVSFCPSDSPFLLAYSGNSPQTSVWNTTDSAVVRSTFIDNTTTRPNTTALPHTPTTADSLAPLPTNPTTPEPSQIPPPTTAATTTPTHIQVSPNSPAPAPESAALTSAATTHTTAIKPLKKGSKTKPSPAETKKPKLKKKKDRKFKKVVSFS
ncbi:G-protein beta WD-40 repeat [Pelomyxa schiedti]|nr:G-protein beta WD-40 repeat [Pelomyxa schiedti]